MPTSNLEGMTPIGFKSPLFVTTIFALIIFACGGPILKYRANAELVNYVDPFIDADFHRHTFPDAILPFGMVQLSPDTHSLEWDACAAYHYSDSSILGFSHTHLSGTGIGDYGDILFMPFTGEVSLNAGPEDQIDSGYRSRFNKEKESARPGYYSVDLTDYNIGVELSSTTHAGMHHYTFPEAENAGILIDLTHTIHGHENPLHEIKVLNEQEIQGLKLTSGWVKNHYVYFTAKFSKPFDAELYLDNQLQEGLTSISGKNAKVKLNFQTEKGEEVIAKVGLSAVSYAGSAKNLNQEINGWDFEYICGEAERVWEEQLSNANTKK